MNGPGSEQAKTSAAQRSLTCPRCGTTFGCDLSGHCWCMDETAKLPVPVPVEGEDCLCPACLRAEAASRGAASSR